MKIMTYAEIRPQLKSGDSLSFSGNGLISTAIKLFSGSKWSHDAMVVAIEEHNLLLCWESTTLAKLKDVDSGVVKSGVMLVPLSNRILTYSGEIGVRQLRKRLTLEQYSILAAMRHEVRDVPYEKDMLELAKAAYDGPFGRNVEDLSSIFCSELKAEFYKRADLIKGDTPANEFTPKDFAIGYSDLLEEMIMIKESL